MRPKKKNQDRAARKAALANLRRLRAHITHLERIYRQAQEQLPRAVSVAGVLSLMDEMVLVLPSQWGW
jgi:Tfp pilus assembly protein PilO